MKRIVSCFLSLLLLGIAVSAAASYSLDPVSGLYVDSQGQVIAEYWDDAGGIYIVDGVGYKIQDADDPSYTGEDNSGQSSSSSSENSAPAGVSYAEDGSMEVESGALPIEEEQNGKSSEGLTPEEWRARMDKAVSVNGLADNQVVWTDENGEPHLAEALYYGLGRSAIRYNGMNLMVPTSSLDWEADVPEDHVLAVVNSKSHFVKIYASTSKKSTVMANCEKLRVLRVVSGGDNWTKVQCDEYRGYIQTSLLTFYGRNSQEYTTGWVTYKGRKDSKNTVHIRSSNTNNAGQLSEFICGTPLTIFYHDDKWCEVDVGGWHAYILTKYVTMDEEPALSASAQ